MSVSYEVRLVDEKGAFLQLLTPERFAWSVVKHDTGVFQATISPEWSEWFDSTRRIEVWRAEDISAPLKMRSYFLRTIADATDSDGTNLLTITGYDGNYLLDSSIVTYRAGSAQAEISGFPPALMSDLVINCLGASSADPLNPTWFSVIAGAVAAPPGYAALGVVKSVAWRNVLAVLKEIADETAGFYTGDGTPLTYPFHIFDRDDHGFEFRCPANYLGRDRTIGTDRPAVFALEFGNLSAASLTWDASEEVNNAFVGGAGEEAERLIGEATGPRATAGLWTRRKGFTDATTLETQAAVDNAAYSLLEARKPVGRFQATINPTQGTRLGYDWGFGDLVSAQYKGTSIEATVDAIKVEVGSDGSEQIAAKLEASVF